MNPLERITERVCRLGHPDAPGTPRPLLTVSEFFEGNTYSGSIGCNLSPQPTPAQFYALFTRFLERPDVEDVRIQITMFDDPEWPFSDMVYVMTSASPEEVATWFDPQLRPDEVGEGFIPGQAYEPYSQPAGSRVIYCWWD
jgi:hypothetical protein